MIHHATHPQYPIHPINSSVNPFYLFITNDYIKRVPLPVAVKQGDPEALAWRDAWERSASIDNKAYCSFHPTLRNWVGGAEDGLDVVQECQDWWDRTERICAQCGMVINA
jgi:hypothetical protein